MIILLKLLLLSLITLIIGVPVFDDEHKTQVYLKRLTDNMSTNTMGQVLLVTIERIDDLKDHETHQLVGKKFTDILLKFSVKEDGSIAVNGGDIPMGVSDVQVATIVRIQSMNETYTADQLKEKFDVGIVNMKLNVMAYKHIDGNKKETFRILIQEKIYEMDHNVLEQHVFQQQLIELSPGGEVKMLNISDQEPQHPELLKLPESSGEKPQKSEEQIKEDVEKLKKQIENLVDHALDKTTQGNSESKKAIVNNLKTKVEDKYFKRKRGTPRYSATTEFIVQIIFLFIMITGVFWIYSYYIASSSNQDTVQVAQSIIKDIKTMQPQKIIKESLKDKKF